MELVRMSLDWMCSNKLTAAAQLFGPACMEFGHAAGEKAQPAIADENKKARTLKVLAKYMQHQARSGEKLKMLQK